MIDAKVMVATRYIISILDNLLVFFLSDNNWPFSCMFNELERKLLYLIIAMSNIALRNKRPANQVCGIKYFKNIGSSIFIKEITTCNRSINALTRKPMPMNKLNLSLKECDLKR